MKSALTIAIRALTEAEIDRLQEALGKPVDRDYLKFWIAKSIADVVRFSAPPTARKSRDHFLQIVRDGRKWLERIDRCPAGSLLGPITELGELRAAVSVLCDQLDATAHGLSSRVRRGHPRIPLALNAFLQNMIGIAKRAKVLPSTPSRAPRKPTARRPAPDFFKFITIALVVATEAIKTSPLAEKQKAAALMVLRVQSNEALGKILEELRGRVGDYREGAHGLVEW